jgi:hypothetical protein
MLGMTMTGVVIDGADNPWFILIDGATRSRSNPNVAIVAFVGGILTKYGSIPSSLSACPLVCLRVTLAIKVSVCVFGDLIFGATLFPEETHAWLLRCRCLSVVPACTARRRRTAATWQS